MQVYFWGTIRKNKSSYRSSRSLKEADITSILQKCVILENHVEKAQFQLLKLPGLKKFKDSLNTDKEKQDFTKHMQRYVQIYLPDCPWEVSTTNRYTVVTHEAAVTARAFIKSKQKIKYLSGIQVIMTKEELETTQRNRRDFSIVFSSRKKASSLFLGPARFANHDCEANARLSTCENAGMEVIAVRDIEIGEEITVTYGGDYFDENNCECLCQSCELKCQNGWLTTTKRQGPLIKESLDKVSKSDQLSVCKRSQAEWIKSTQIRDPAITDYLEIDMPCSTKSQVSCAEKQSIFPKRLTRSKRKFIEAEAALTSSKRSRSKYSHDITSISIEQSPAPSCITSTPHSGISSVGETHSSTDETSADEEILRVTVPEIGPTKSWSLKPRKIGKSGSRLLHQEKHRKEKPNAKGLKPADPPRRSSRNLSGRVREQFLQQNTDAEHKPKENTKRDHRRYKPISDADHAPAVRVPGDYKLTSRLIVDLASEWIECQNCDNFFVQVNAYTPRSSCPRCERHSKLYGYRWPKTQKEDSDDEEERVLDHRTINRFVHPEQRKAAKKHHSIRSLSFSDIKRARTLSMESLETLQISGRVTRGSTSRRST
ncbi:putative histone-lysine n-methyltransferase set9 protein [Golovinomyces cichoracearum]|uniref:Histone-lysine N-methyltransferase SET9 n=1 Tax=Golovinomyces cichoracearum TaxID=62708 RepID=A0A420J779_9PEZI|nr:putative histone-lysine n-methyltransferase set9 protein [Golovinomyces cichoracearum]